MAWRQQRSWIMVRTNLGEALAKVPRRPCWRARVPRSSHFKYVHAAQGDAVREKTNGGLFILYQSRRISFEKGR
jgi:hypothetical protein